MIKTDKQYQVTKKKLKEFSEALKDIEILEDSEPLLKKIQIDAIKSQIEDFNKEILEYEALRKGSVSFIRIDNIDNIYEVLIKGRLARGFSQAELASKLKLKEQQIQRYEACNYSTASLPRIIQVATELGVSFCPIKVKLAEPKFDIPKNYNKDIINNAQQFLKEKRTLISVD